MALIFTTKQCELDFAARAVNFVGIAGGGEIACHLSFEALAVYFGVTVLTRSNLLAAFDANRDQIEQAAIARHDHGLREWDGSIFLEADDLAAASAK